MKNIISTYPTIVELSPVLIIFGLVFALNLAHAFFNISKGYDNDLNKQMVQSLQNGTLDILNILTAAGLFSAIISGRVFGFIDIVFAGVIYTVLVLPSFLKKKGIIEETEIG